MTFDYGVLLGLWVVLPLLLLVVIPRSRVREFLVVLIFFQSLTWIVSIVLTAFGLLSSPVLEFGKATKINFTMEYLVFPVAAVLFHRWYPIGLGKVRQVLHYIISVAGILLFMFLIGRYTHIMKIEIGNLIRSGINFMFELWLCRKYMVWLLEKVKLSKDAQVKHV
jgi:hypothetical protein